MLKRGVPLGLSVLVLLGGSFACGETNDGNPNPGGAAGTAPTAGASSHTTTCPQQTPTRGTPCQGALSCSYQAFLGCYPSPVLATCKEGHWDVPDPKPYTGPCPGDPLGEPECPAQPPMPATQCPIIPTVDGPPRTFDCEYTDASCVEPHRVATCNGQWTITPCVAVNAGGAGAGGEAAGGAPSEGGAGGAGGAE